MVLECAPTVIHVDGKVPRDGKALCVGNRASIFGGVVTVITNEFRGGEKQWRLSRLFLEMRV